MYPLLLPLIQPGHKIFGIQNYFSLTDKIVRWQSPKLCVFPTQRENLCCRIEKSLQSGPLPLLSCHKQSISRGGGNKIQLHPGNFSTVQCRFPPFVFQQFVIQQKLCSSNIYNPLRDRASRTYHIRIPLSGTNIRISSRCHRGLSGIRSLPPPRLMGTWCFSFTSPSSDTSC